MSTETTSISAAQVKELRERSGAPMMDCKNALSEAKGDIEGALIWLRKKEIAMHIAAADPKFVRKEDVTPEAYEKEKEIYRAQAAATGKPANVVEKILEGKMAKFYEEVCLMDQPFVKEPGITIHQLIASKIGKLGENISVRRFARFKVGDVGDT